MRRMRILWPLLAVLVLPGTASAAPGDPHVVYLANSFAGGPVILRLDPASGAVAEVSRNGAQGNLFQRPYDLAVEADGSLVVADLGQPNRRDGALIRVDPLTGRQSLLSSGGSFFDPTGVAVGHGGQLWVVDSRAPDNDGAVIRVDPATGAQSVVSTSDELDVPFGIAVRPDGRLVVTNRMTPGPLLPNCLPLGKLVRVDPIGGAQALLAQAGSLGWPLGLAALGNGSTVVANECALAGGLVRVNASGGQSVVTPNGNRDVLVTPERVAVDPGGSLLVSDYALGGGDGGVARVDPRTGAQSLVSAHPLFDHPLGIAAVVNRPPQARLAVDPPVVAAGRPVILDASGSSDPEAQRLVYDWDLDEDGSFEAGSGNTATASRTFSGNGPARVRVRVHDPHAANAQAEATVTVDGAVPLISRLRSSARVLGVGRERRKRTRGRAAGAPVRRREARERRRLPRAATIRFDLSEPAGVNLLVERARAGRRRGTRPCRVRARRGRRCFVWSRARELERLAVAGPNRIRIRARGLRPGRHRVVLSAVDAVGNPSATRRLPMRVVRRR
jgi:DNA-binding beta-propeller fold protein YncE